MSQNSIVLFLTSMPGFFTMQTNGSGYHSGLNLFISMFNNLALFIVLVAIYRILITYVKKKQWLIQQLVLGGIFGLFVFGCMNVRIPVADGVLVDQRNTIVILAGWFGGPLAALISAIIAAVYRNYLGGAGVFAGIIGLGLSTIAGSILYWLGKRTRTILGVLLSAVGATFFILPGFLFYGSLNTGWELMKKMSIPYGFAIFFGIFVGSILFIRENHYRNTETERKQAVENLKTSLIDKEMLLKEVHHRVKNNMQVIIALLNLQMEQSKSALFPILNDIIGRIQIFANIHSSLYNYDNVSQINFVSHLQNNFDNIVAMYCDNQKLIDIEIDKGGILKTTPS